MDELIGLLKDVLQEIKNINEKLNQMSSAGNYGFGDIDDRLLTISRSLDYTNAILDDISITKKA